MELYLLKSAACLVLMLVFYKLVLERSSMHQIKRIFLLSAVILPLVIPTITITTYVEASEVAAIKTTGVPDLLSTGSSFEIPWENILWTIYFSGAGIFGLRFGVRLYRIISRIRMNPRERLHDIIKVLLPQQVVPHTFLSYIFLNVDSAKRNDIPSEVMEHEKVHARELHSLDIILVELAKVIFWFNPFIYWLSSSIKLNHEFLADSTVLRNGYDAAKYQQTILAYSSHATVPAMAHSINYSSLKKRFTVMRTKSSRLSVWLKSLLVLPLLALTLYSFSSRETITLPSEEVVSEFIQQTSASREEMKEYNALARKYNAMKKEERVVKLDEMKRMEYIYQKMSDKQRADAEPFPECIPPPPPPAPDVPKVRETPNATGSVPPPPPPPPAPESLGFDELMKKGDLFYLDGKQITRKEARDLKDKLSEMKTVHIVRETNGKNVVYFQN